MAKGLNVKIGADVSAMEKSLKSINSHIKASDAAVNQLNKELKLNPSGVDALQSKLKTLGSELTAQEAKTRNLKSQLAAWSSALKESGGQNTAAANKVRELTNAVAQSESKEREIKSQIDATNSALNSQGSAANEAANGMNMIGDVAIGNILSDLATKAADAAKQFAELAVNTAAAAEASQEYIKSYGGYSNSDMGEIAQEVASVSTAYGISQDEIYKGAIAFSQAGFSADELSGSLENVAKFAKTAGIDFSTASDEIIRIMNSGSTDYFGDLESTLDFISYGANQAYTSIQDFGEITIFAAQYATAYGQDLKSLAAVTQTIASITGDSSNAMTEMRRLMQDLTDQSTSASTALSELGVSVYDSDGSMRDITDILSDYITATDKLTDAEKAQYDQTLLGQKGQAAINALRASGVDSVYELRDAYSNCADSMDSMYENIGGTYQDSMDKLTAAWDNVAQSIGNRALPILQEAAEKLAYLLNNSVSDSEWVTEGDQYTYASEEIAASLDGVREAGEHMIYSQVKQIDSLETLEAAMYQNRYEMAQLNKAYADGEISDMKYMEDTAGLTNEMSALSAQAQNLGASQEAINTVIDDAAAKADASVNAMTDSEIAASQAASMAEQMGETVKAANDTEVDAVSSAAGSVTSDQQAIIDSNSGVSNSFTTLAQSATSNCDNIGTAWDRLKAKISAGIQGVINIQNQNGSQVYTYAKGIDYVPQNNWPSMLHKGEAVLTKSEADRWRAGESGGTGTTINITSTGLSQSDIDYIMASANRRLA